MCLCQVIQIDVQLPQVMFYEAWPHTTADAGIRKPQSRLDCFDLL